MKPVAFFLALLFGITACTNNNEKEAEQAGPSGSLYCLAEVWAEEGRSDVTVRMQFREKTADGEPVRLPHPGQVLLDGTALEADSTKFAGTYYEASFPLTVFAGQHTLQLTGVGNRAYRQVFTFRPFFLAGEFPEKQALKPFVIPLANLPENGTNLRLVMTDTSFQTSDVNEEIWVSDNTVSVTKNHLSFLTKGPVLLELYSENEIPWQKQDRFSGQIKITYGVKRQILLESE